MDSRKTTNSLEVELEQILKDYGDRVLNVCYSFLNSREDAEDAAQEVFVEVYLATGKFSTSASFSSWIFRVAVNKSIDAIRRRNRKKRVADLTSLFQYKKDAKPYLGPVESLNEKERSLILHEEIERLPERQRVAIVLCKIEEMSVKEAAEVMQTSSSSVESLLFRGRTNLERNLRQRYGSKGAES